MLAYGKKKILGLMLSQIREIRKRLLSNKNIFS